MRNHHGRRWLLYLPAVLLAISVSGTPAHSEEDCRPDSILAAPQNIFTGLNPRHALPLDVDEDGILDLVILESSFHVGGPSRIAVHLGNGDGGTWSGSFTPLPPVIDGARSLGLVAADFNEDDILDLAMTNWGDGTARILIGGGSAGVGDGSYTLGQLFAVGPNPYGVAAGDFNADGIMDLVVASNGSSTARVFHGEGAAGVGAGTFAPGPVVTVPNTSLSVVAADFNEDGRDDFAATASYSGTVVVALSQPGGTFSSLAYAAGLEPFDVHAHDMDGDGILDLVVGNASSGGVGILRGQGADGVGNGIFASPIFVGNGAFNVTSVTVEDFDGDGLIDLMFAHVASSQGIYYARANGPLTFDPPVRNATGNTPFGLQTADFNEDGRADVTVAHFTGNFVSLFLGQCVALPPPPQPEPLLDDVRDAPNDQGGKVFVTWRRSDLDGVRGTTVNAYRVWRRIPPAAAKTLATVPNAIVRETRSESPAGVSVVYWEAMATLPAQRLEGYGYTSATTQDSLPGSNPHTAFFVTALTANPEVFYDSVVDSGYSVDNLAPPAPTVFVAQFIPVGLALHWTPSDAPDLAVYHLHRGTRPDFVPNDENRIATLPDTGYVDPVGSASTSYYKLCGVDIHANRGPFATVSPDGPTAVTLSLVEASATDEGIALAWFASGAVDGEFRVEHRVGDGAWEVLGAATVTGDGMIRFVDRSAQRGRTHQYRLAFEDRGATRTAGEIEIVRPALEFGLAGMYPNPRRGSERLDFAVRLTGEGRATLEILDVQGRLRHAEEITDRGAGEHTVSIAKRLAAGLYLVRLREADRMRSAKLAVVD